MSKKATTDGLASRCIRTMVKNGMKGRDALKAAVSLSEADLKRAEELKAAEPKTRGDKKWKKR